MRLIPSCLPLCFPSAVLPHFPSSFRLVPVVCHFFSIPFGVCQSRSCLFPALPSRSLPRSLLLSFSTVGFSISLPSAGHPSTPTPFPSNNTSCGGIFGSACPQHFLTEPGLLPPPPFIPLTLARCTRRRRNTNRDQTKGRQHPHPPLSPLAEKWSFNAQREKTPRSRRSLSPSRCPFLALRSS